MTELGEAFTAFEALARSRRSVRAFLPDPVPDDVLVRCLALALVAPNSHNLHPWQFVCVRAAAVQAELRRDCLDQEATRTAPTFIVAVARPDFWRFTRRLNLQRSQARRDEALVHKYRDLVPLMFEDGPLHLLAPLKWAAAGVGGLAGPTWRGPFGYWAQQLWATKTTALACENLMLALRAAGYDSCPMEGFDEPRVKGLLGLPGAARVVVVLAAGRRAAGGVSEQVRFDPALFVRWV